VNSSKHNPTVGELIKDLEEQKQEHERKAKEIDEELTVLKRARGRVAPKESPCETKSEVKANLTVKNTVEDIARQVLTQSSESLTMSEIARKAVEMGIWQSKNPVQGMASALKRAEEKQCPWLGISKGEKRGTKRYYLKKEN
jgi:hypothetical protein